MNTWKRLRYWTLALALVALSIMLVACGNAAEDGDDAPIPTPDGSAVFAANCASCHGDDGSGGSRGPAIRPNDKSQDELLAIIADGIEGTRMPAYRGRISQTEIGTVIDYLREK